MQPYRKLAIVSFFAFVMALPGWSDIKPEKVQSSDVRKTNVYMSDGVITGGDRAINDPVVTGIRRAANASFDRIVIDLEANVNGGPAAIPRPPYYQVAVNRDEKRVIVTISGNPRLTFDSEKVVKDLKKSVLIQNVQLFPRMNESVWTFALELKAAAPVEVFELADPVRIVMDLKRDKAEARMTPSP